MLTVTDTGSSKSSSPLSSPKTSSTSPPGDEVKKKTSIKENIISVLRSPNTLLKRESTKRQWAQMREAMGVRRLKSAVRDSRLLFSPGERRRRSDEKNATSPPPISPAAGQRLSPNEWTFAFDHVITDADGRAQFTKFLQSEYSEENILFWWAVQELKLAVNDRAEFERSVREMFDTFIAADSPLAINIDHDTRMDIIERVQNGTPDTYPDNIYERAQAHVYRLMEKDCFSRFVHTPAYKDLAKRLNLPQTFRFNGRLSPI